MISVAIQGAQGKLGSKIVEHLENSSDFTYVGAVTRDSAVPECDVVVAVSGAEGTNELLPKLKGQKLLIGSTGHIEMDPIQQYAESSAVLLAPNFSIGMRVLYDVLRNLDAATCAKFSSLIDDVHHVHKKDSPSGTALQMQSILKKNGVEVTIESKRSAEVLGNHSLILENNNERITLSHEVLNRDVYAEGCLELLLELNTLEAGVYFR